MAKKENNIFWNNNDFHHKLVNLQINLKNNEVFDTNTIEGI